MSNFELWMKALRSGQYAKGTTQLCRIRPFQQFYSVLGVACDIYEREVQKKIHYVSTIQGLIDYRYHAMTVKIYGKENMIAFLPKEVHDWLEIKFIDQYGQGTRFNVMDLDYPFPQMAKVLEDEYRSNR